jgi:hypothetical protein
MCFCVGRSTSVNGPALQELKMRFDLDGFAIALTNPNDACDVARAGRQ